MALSDDQKAMLRLLAQREQGYDDIAALTGSSVADVRSKVRDATAALDSGLSQDQRAMLRLLAQREEGYDDIAALTGASVEEVRARVRAALDGLEGDAAAPPPAAPKGAPEPPPAMAEKTEKAKEPATAEKIARAEKAPAPKVAPRAPRPGGAKPTSAGLPGGIKLPEDRGVRRALAAGGAVVLVLLLLLVTGVIGGDDDGDSGSTGSGESTVASEIDLPDGGGREPTEAVLSAVDGSDAKGQALFGRSGRNVVLLLSAEGLRPSPPGQSYTVSLVRSPTQRLPLVAAEATDSGIISGRFQIAPQVLGLLAGGFDEMEVSLVDDDVLRAALAQARKTQKAPDYDGTTALSGEVTGPIVEAGEG